MSHYCCRACGQVVPNENPECPHCGTNHSPDEIASFTQKLRDQYQPVVARISASRADSYLIATTSDWRTVALHPNGTWRPFQQRAEQSNVDFRKCCWGMNVT